MSIGAALLDPALPALSSVAAADDALYVAKAKGRDQVVVQPSRSTTGASLS